MKTLRGETKGGGIPTRRLLFIPAINCVDAHTDAPCNTGFQRNPSGNFAVPPLAYWYMHENTKK